VEAVEVVGAMIAWCRGEHRALPLHDGGGGAQALDRLFVQAG
jgi:hypothetical protein